jgi:hypothetical protein
MEKPGNETTGHTDYFLLVDNITKLFERIFSVTHLMELKKIVCYFLGVANVRADFAMGACSSSLSFLLIAPPFLPYHPLHTSQ